MSSVAIALEHLTTAGGRYVVASLDAVNASSGGIARIVLN